MRVWVSGGTGYVGGAVVEALRASGHRVTLLCHERRPAPREGVALVEGDVRLEGAWTESLEGHDAVVHLVAILREWVSRGVTFEALHVGATHRVLAAARRAGVGRFVHMSALGVGRCRGSRYFDTKAQAEEEVRRSGLAWTILRPSFVFGDASPFFALVRRLGRAPLTPVVGAGDVPFQPVALEDVATAVVRVLERSLSVGQVYEMGGPDVVTYRRLLDLAAGRPVRALTLPPALVRSVARLFEAWPAFPVTADQVAMLGCANVAGDRRWQEDLGIEPASFVAWANLWAGGRAGGPDQP